MIRNTFKKIKNWYRELPNKKKHIEFITALLSVPVLLTVLIGNLNNLNKNKQTTPVPTTQEKVIIVNNEVTPKTSLAPTQTLAPSPTTYACKQEVGPVKITSPVEDQLITTNQVCVKTNYQVGEYCSVVYSYSINNSEWSDYTDGTICISDLTIGLQELELKIKSSQSDDEVVLIRNFYYKNKLPVTPTILISPTP